MLAEVAEAATRAAAAVPGWAWAGMGLLGAGVGRALASWQAERAVRRQVEAKCDTCGKPESKCKCPDGTASSLRLEVKETLAGVRAMAETVGRVDTRLLNLEGEVQDQGRRLSGLEDQQPQLVLRLANQIAGAKVELGRADPLAHLVDQPERKVR